MSSCPAHAEGGPHWVNRTGLCVLCGKRPKRNDDVEQPPRPDELEVAQDPRSYDAPAFDADAYYDGRTA